MILIYLLSLFFSGAMQVDAAQLAVESFGNNTSLSITVTPKSQEKSNSLYFQSQTDLSLDYLLAEVETEEESLHKIANKLNFISDFSFSYAEENSLDVFPNYLLKIFWNHPSIPIHIWNLVFLI